MNNDVTAFDDDCMAGAGTTSTPSIDFIHAISEFLDTDPNDLLVELGYYNRTNTNVSESNLTSAIVE